MDIEFEGVRADEIVGGERTALEFFFLKTRAPLPRRRCPGDRHTGRRGGCSTGLPALRFAVIAAAAAVTVVVAVVVTAA